MSKPRLMLVGDVVRHTGFARVNEAIASHLSDRWDIAILGVQYKGDPCEQQQQYRLYPALLGGDVHGVGRLADILRLEQPAACLFVCDPWIGADYARALGELPNVPPCVLYTPVDATNLRRIDIQPLNSFMAVVVYTQFGERELRRSGYTGPLAVIPHGIDLDLFRPIDRAEARSMTGLPQDRFAVLVLDQNNPRKRLDIAFDAFARFAADKPANVKLVYHGPLGGKGRWDIMGMAEDLDIDDRLILPRRDGLSIPNDQMAYLYSMCDVKLSTTSGEGWGLTTMEAMACGVPNIAPDFAALGEWGRGAIEYLGAETPLRHVEIGTIGRSPTADEARVALNNLYLDAERRERLRDAGLAKVRQPEYRWEQIADAFHAVLCGAIEARQAWPVAREVTPA